MFIFNDTVSYTCDIGLEIRTGNQSRRCNAQGFWTGSLPLCESKWYSIQCLESGLMWLACLIANTPIFRKLTTLDERTKH